MWVPWRRTDRTAEAEAALKDARRNLRRVKGRTAEVREVSAALREVRERNHLAEQIDDIIALRRGRWG